MERHTVSRLIGAPPGYVGFDQGGLLTDGVDQHPHCVLLLDEIEKAHPDLFNVLLQIMDHGKLTDHNGKQVDFRNVILIMTTNAGAADLAQGGLRLHAHQARGRRRRGDQPHVRAGIPQPARRHHHLRASLARRSSPRWSRSSCCSSRRSSPTATSPSSSSEEATKWLIDHGYDEQMGARPMARVIQEHIKKPLADEVLFGKLKAGGHVRVVVAKDEDGRDKLGFEYLEGPVTPKPEKLPEPRKNRAKRRPSPRKPRPAGPKGGDAAGRAAARCRRCRWSRSRNLGGWGG